jgi:hypothetical protein
MSNSSEKLVKQALKLVSRSQDIEYEDLKADAKKVIKMARNYDAELLGMMEELMDLGNIGSVEELDDFNIEVLRIYCRIKEIEDTGSDKSVRARVWEHIESEFELDSDDDLDDEDEELEDLDDEDEDDEEIKVSDPDPEPEPIKIKREKKKSVEV